MLEMSVHLSPIPLLMSALVMPLAAAAATYVELIRNTPFIVQLFFIFFQLQCGLLQWPV